MECLFVVVIVKFHDDICIWSRELGTVYNSRVSCQKGPTRHAYAWQIGPFWQDTLVLLCLQQCTYTVCISHQVRPDPVLHGLLHWSGLHRAQSVIPHRCAMVTTGTPWLKRKCYNFWRNSVTGCTGRCHFDNFQCIQWAFRQNEK